MSFIIRHILPKVCYSSPTLTCTKLQSVLSARRLFSSSPPPSLHIHKNMRIELIPAFEYEKNYIYLLIDDKTKQCAAIDPVDPGKVLEAVSKYQVELTSVLTTHHHWDHAGGNEKLNELKPGLKFYGGDDRIGPASQVKVKHEDKFNVGSLTVQCLFTPCHTTGHMCYYVEDTDNDPAVFTGDTLFAGGCGRFFEGTKDQMYHALVGVLQKLPHSTRVYCGHEYTVANLQFARQVEPDNQHIAGQLAKFKAMREANKATIPTTIADEMKMNPFMRVCEEAVKKHTGQTDPVEVMGALRSEKDSWKPPKL